MARATRPVTASSDPITTATYYNANKEGRSFDIVSRNDDGTINLGRGKDIVVRGCKLVDAPAEGCAMAGGEPVRAEEAPETPSAASQASAAALSAAENS